MQMMIEIDEKTVQEVKWKGLWLSPKYEEDLIKAIKNGIPLPKGHGDLIDADATFTKLNERIHVVDAIIATEHGTYINNEIPLWMWSALIEETTIIKADKENKE